jgi:hypothetical protein
MSGRSSFFKCNKEKFCRREIDWLVCDVGLTVKASLVSASQECNLICLFLNLNESSQLLRINFLEAHIEFVWQPGNAICCSERAIICFCVRCMIMHQQHTQTIALASMFIITFSTKKNPSKFNDA